MGETKKETLVKKVVRRFTRYKRLSFDKLQMYYGDPFVIDIEGVKGSLTIYQPTIGDIVSIGEKKFYTTLNVFVANTSTYKTTLWKENIDWNSLSDFELFMSLYKNAIDPDVSKLLFHDVDFSSFELYAKKDPNSEAGKYITVLYSPTLDIEIDELVYQYIHQYLQTVFNLFPEEKYTKDEFLKKWWVDSEERELKQRLINQEKGLEDPDASNLQSIISSCVNHPGFKYNLKELRELNVCFFFDCVKRLQVYESSTACLKGMYSGFVDGSKIKPDEYNFMKEI